MTVPLPRTALVTGVAGFIASHLAQALLDRGTRVTGVDRRSPETDADAATNLAGCLDRPGFTLARADLLDCPLAPLLDAADVVFHLAGIPGVRASWGTRFPDYVAGNILATHRIAAACHQLGVPRLVVASSSSVYGPVGDRPVTEDAPTHPASPYGVTKLAAEQLALAYGTLPQPRTTVVALRYFTVYGPRQRPDMLIQRALRAAAGGEKLLVYGDGNQRRDFTYVGDVVRATLRAAAAPGTAEVLNVAGGHSASVAEVLATIAALTGRPVPTRTVPDQPGDVPGTWADTGRARSRLNWRPKTALADGLARQLDWLRSHQLGGHR
ncbi:NAD-dependent epimerase/dehydratase family protein [Streptomyces sp. NPDC057743]|uniref:NAD-dependent epimerase/dehydratase family protein n=1 Tax=Streptomyces sp. NPDC057743 TaxID=3346236 RepID=UPI00367DD3E6